MIHALAKAWLHMGNDKGVRVIVIGSTKRPGNFLYRDRLERRLRAPGDSSGLAQQSGYGPVLGSGRRTATPA